MQGSVTVHFAAAAAEVWDLVSDVTRIGEFSPETFEAGWLDGATGPRAGARFRGHVRRNGRWPVYWTTCTVTVSDPGREFAFEVNNGWVRWSYTFARLGGGTELTESWDFRPAGIADLEAHHRTIEAGGE